jgi:rhamnulokinase
MARKETYIAIDLGASSGRAVAVHFDGERIDLEEVHRFSNSGVAVGDSLYWDVLRLYEEMLNGLRACVQKHGGDIAGIGVDTWGVDYALLDARGDLIGNPYCYRDPRTQGMMNAVFERVSREEIFDHTGLQFMELNTLFQLYAMAKQNHPQLEMARSFLMMPDLFNYWFTGRKACEFSDATTTQFYDPRKGDWSTELLDRLGIPTGMLTDIVPSGTTLGPLRPSIADDVGAGSVDVIAPACHDTGSAVAAVPMTEADAAYISCGTWALLGAEIQEPAITPDVLDHNFTNEGGVFGTFRFLKNITGLWLVQECKRVWDLEGNTRSFAELTGLASKADPLVTLVDPDHADFATPGDFPDRIRSLAEQTGQPLPESEGAVIRCAIESLAMKCRYVLGNLEEVLGRRMKVVHIVGGGIQNTLLCQLVADATGRPVVAGPVEATALGNILMQAYARGRIGSLAEIRQIVRNSTDLVTYEPGDIGPWDEASERFAKML